jgi:hypothetical protein
MQNATPSSLPTRVRVFNVPVLIVYPLKSGIKTEFFVEHGEMTRLLSRLPRAASASAPEIIGRNPDYLWPVQWAYGAANGRAGACQRKRL